ncbi:Transcriptional regulator RFX1 [Candida viswanathii]|uniref:Transcriptional regulator RFX1 n=1 Tax=Candida viswanathii TaxID=5486 RepID=A0A367Y8Y3_9ASCO|nr:Transcriptional regulator RFX1 [Candida viswanathii]
MNQSQLPQDQQTGATGTTTEGTTPQQQQPMPHIPSASQPHSQLQNYQPHQQHTPTPGFVKQMDMNQQYMPPTHQQQPHFQPPSQQTSPSTYYTQPNYPPPINYQQQQPGPPPPPPPQQAQVPQQPLFQFDYSHSYTTQQPHHFPSTSSTTLLPNNFQHFQPIHENTAQHPQSIQEQESIQKRKRPRRQDSIHASAGESELKQMALQSTEVPLSDLAHKIKQLENDVSHSTNSDQSKLKENKETQRLLFGMVWLLNSCELSPTAVIPRNRIYARYVQVCADNSLAPVSPASFGKLVKILYPNITTRRLGMRGQSKYHYCGIKLNGDENMQLQLLSLQHQQQQQAQQQVQKQAQHHHHHHQRLESMLSGFSGQAQSPMSSSSSVSYDESPAPMSRPHTPSFTPINSPGILFSTTLNDQLPLVLHMKYIPNLFQLLNSNADPSSNPYTPIQLPSIYPYLTRDADYDIADTLYSLYKVHVNAIFESLRYMQLKKLFSCFNNFNSILTAPVFKLYTTDSVTDWIMKCDLIMYKKMIRMLSKLQLQLLIPQEQLLQLKQIASGYIKSLATSLVNSKVSTNFVIMKLKLAKHFVNLLNRLIKVIETGQPASRILTDDTEKNSMIQDWIKLNLEEVINREMPCSDKNIECLSHILSSEVVELIKIKQEPSNTNTTEDTTNPTTAMNNFANYVSNLPSRFPDINARLFLVLSSNLLTTCLREISLLGGEGFGAWWIVRCWVDEYLAWSFEVGGFFQDDLQDALQHQESPSMLPSLQNHPPDQEYQQAQDEQGDMVFGNIDLLETSFDLDSKNLSQQYAAAQQSQAESLLNFDTNIDNLLN